MSNRIGKRGQFAQNHRCRIASPAKRSELDAPRMPPDFIVTTRTVRAYGTNCPAGTAQSYHPESHSLSVIYL
jgi:hypothetical protein